MGGEYIMINRRELKKHNEHVVNYLVFIMGELSNRMSIKELFNIIDYQGLEGLRNEYNKI